MADWYVQTDGQERGPLSPPELRKLVQAGEVTADTPVRLGADGKWIAAGRVRGLLPESSAAAAAASKPAGHRAERSASAGAKNTPSVDASRRAVAPPADPRPLRSETPPRSPAAQIKAQPARAIREKRESAAPSPAASLYVAGLPPAPVPSPVLNGLGIASVVCGGLGLLLASWTAAMVAMTSLGVLVALAAIVWGLVRRRAGLGLPIAGAVVCTGVLGAVLAFQNFVSAHFSTVRRLESTNRASGAGDVSLIEAESQFVRFDDDIAWTRADRPVQIGDIEVEIDSVVVDTVMLNDLGTQQPSQKAYFTVRLRIKNLSRFDSRDYRSWSGAGALTDIGHGRLIDRAGQDYPREDFGLGLRVEGQMSSATVAANESLEDVLIFQSDGLESDMYRLELPASAVGEEGVFRFAIPAASIRKSAE